MMPRAGPLFLAALLLAGCLGLAPGGDPASDAATRAAGDPASPSMEWLELSYEGETPTRVSAGASQAGGASLPPASPGYNTWYPLRLPQPASMVRVVVTWEAASDATRVLALSLSGDQGAGTEYPRAEGPSPLQVEWDLGPYAHEALALSVGAAEVHAAGPVAVALHRAQSFEVEVALLVPASKLPLPPESVVATPFRDSGETSLGLCVHAAVAAPCASPTSADDVTVLAPEGKPLEIRGAVTRRDASAPCILRVFVGAEDRLEEGGNFYGRAQVGFRFDARAYDAGTRFRVLVECDADHQGRVGFVASPPQAYSLEGEVLEARV